jgi:hypothetical protein
LGARIDFENDEKCCKKEKGYEKTVTKYLIKERRLKMRRTIPLLALALVLGLTLYPIEGRAQMGPGYGMGPGMMGYGYGGYGMGPGMMGRGYGGYGMGPGMMGYGYGMGPGMMGYGMGPGMMGYGYGGYGMGPGMMGCPGYGGYGMGPWMMRHHGMGYGYGYGYGPQYREREKPLTEDEAKEMVEHYLKNTRNPNLKLGKVTAKGAYYEADVETKDNSLVDKILVDKYTGWMRSAY